MIYPKELYVKQAKGLIEKAEGLNMQDFERLYEAAAGREIDDKKILIEKIMKEVFGGPYYTEPLIPWSFYNSAVNEVIALVMFGINSQDEPTITAPELAKLMNVSPQYINAEKKREKIKAIGKRSENGPWIFKESDVNEYLKKRGISLEKLKAKIKFEE